MPGALSGVRVCDLSGQLAGAGATRILAAFGAEVIRVEDPSRQGRWDIQRGAPPYVDERRGIELGGAFNNHNVGKMGVTINFKTARGHDLLRQLIAESDVVTENFSAGVMGRMGLSFEELQIIRPDIIYVSNCGFGHSGPYEAFKTWGPIVQALCGLTFSSGLPGMDSAGWGLSYMDHHGANFMAIAVLAALAHRNRTGEGQWIDMACTEAGAALAGPALLDYTVNGRPLRRAGMPDSNHSQSPVMSPHNVFPCAGDDEWMAIACRHDDDWLMFVEAIGEEWPRDARFTTCQSRVGNQNELDLRVGAWTSRFDKFELAARLQRAGIPAAAVQKPPERIDRDANTEAWGLWPTVSHPEIGEVRVDGLPVHLSETDWVIERGAPCLGEHNTAVFGELLGLDDAAMADLRSEGAI